MTQEVNIFAFEHVYLLYTSCYIVNHYCWMSSLTLLMIPSFLSHGSPFSLLLAVKEQAWLQLCRFFEAVNGFLRRRAF